MNKEEDWILLEGTMSVAKLDEDGNRKTVFMPLSFEEDISGEKLFKKINYNKKSCNVDKVCSLFLEYCMKNKSISYFEVNYYNFIIYVIHKYGLEDLKSELLSKDYMDKIIQSVKIKNNIEGF